MDNHAYQTERAHEILRKMLRLVPLHDERLDFRFGRLAHHALDLSLVFRQLKFAGHDQTPGPNVVRSGTTRSLLLRSALNLMASIRLMISKWARAADSRMLVLMPAPR